MDAQEAALSAAVWLADSAPDDDVTVCVCVTDGSDGPTPATGAVVDRFTVSAGAAKGLCAAEHLARHDAHTFFAGLRDESLVVTGPTGTNVMDIVIMLCGGKAR